MTKRRRSPVKLEARSISLEPQEWATLTAMAQAHGASVSCLISEILSPWLHHTQKGQHGKTP